MRFTSALPPGVRGRAKPGGPRAGGPSTATGYAVVDVETTGLDAQHHRVVECAVVELDEACATVREWASLVDVPGTGDLGASGIHGITRPMLAGAPSFADLVPEIVERLSGRVVVGHVVAFDLGHLAAEFARAGLPWPDLAGRTLCTRDLARRYLPPGRATLAACCAATGISITDEHTALGDARAAAALLAWFAEAGHDAEWVTTARRARAVRWPAVGAAHGARASLAVARPTGGAPVGETVARR